MNDKQTPDGENLPSTRARRIWTTLLLVHFAAVFLTVQSNALPVSPFRETLGDTPLRRYLSALHMDTAYAFYLTDGDDLDFDHALTIELDDALEDGGMNRRSTTLHLPDDDAWLGERKRRMKRLAVEIAARAEEDPTGVLPGAVAKGMLAQAGVESGTHDLKCQRRQIVVLDDAAETDPALSDPFDPARLQMAYEADVICTDGGVFVNKRVAESEAAAVRGE